jgi:hypothetical protein
MLIVFIIIQKRLFPRGYNIIWAYLPLILEFGLSDTGDGSTHAKGRDRSRGRGQSDQLVRQTYRQDASRLIFANASSPEFGFNVERSTVKLLGKPNPASRCIAL